MRRIMVTCVLSVIVHAATPNPAEAGVFSKLFGEMFQSWGSKSASEAGQAAARNADQAVPPPRATDDEPLQDAGKFIAEEAAGNAAQEGVGALFEEDDSQFDTRY